MGILTACIRIYILVARSSTLRPRVQHNNSPIRVERRTIDTVKPRTKGLRFFIPGGSCTVFAHSRFYLEPRC